MILSFRVVESILGGVNLTVKHNLEIVQQKVEQACRRIGRNPKDINIIATTKYVDIFRTKEVLDAGIVHIGESRVEDGLRKREHLENRGTWHFIGTLQSRKVKEIINVYDYFHSLDRLSLAKEIEKRAIKPVPCFVQVNVSGEQTKHGISSDEVISFIKELSQFSLVRVIGLMTMAPHVDDPEETRIFFRKLKQLQENVQALNLHYAPCSELSMGMSNDFEIAIEEGATYIRLGTSLVGQ